MIARLLAALRSCWHLSYDCAAEHQSREPDAVIQERVQICRGCQAVRVVQYEYDGGPVMITVTRP